MRKRNYEVIKMILILISILTVLQTVFLCIKPDTLRIILSIVVYVCLIAVIVMFIISKKDLKRVIFDGSFDEYKIRLVEDDDFQYVRLLLDSSPLENTPEEIAKLNEYQKITIDFTRIDYHYIVIKNDTLVCIFHSSMEGNKATISFKNEFEDLNKVKEILNNIASSKQYEINYKE